MRSANYKPACRIYKEFRLIIYQLCRDDLIEYILFDILMNLLLRYFRVMLRRKHNCIQTLYRTIFIVLCSYLSLSVRTQVSQRSVFANFSKLKCKLMCQCDRIWHILFCLIRSITEHHSLISCSNGFDIFI